MFCNTFECKLMENICYSLLHCMFTGYFVNFSLYIFTDYLET